MRQYVNMGKAEFSHYLWRNLSSKTSFEFGEFFDTDTGTSHNLFRVMLVSNAGVGVAVCNRLTGGDPFAFDVPYAREDSVEDEFVDAFCEYLDCVGDYAFMDGVWCSEAIVREEKKPRILKASRYAFITDIFYAVRNKGCTDFYLNSTTDSEFFRVVSLTIGLPLVLADSNRGGKLFCHEIEFVDEDSAEQKFTKAFGAYLDDQGFGDVITYTPLNW